MPSCALALTLNDPEGRLAGEIQGLMPILGPMFQGVAVTVTDATNAASVAALIGARARIERDPDNSGPGAGVGRHRRLAVAAALEFGAETILYCDGDRALHWASTFPDELSQVSRRIAEYDFTVLGRTTRAFASHPRIQRDTEAIINYVYLRVSDHDWDVGAGARGLSRPAAQAILAGCPDTELSNDVSWPLFLEQSGDLSVAYLETEGLEFETADRYPDEVAEAGGIEAWMEQVDGDPRRWLFRLEVARIEIEGMLAYVRGAHAASMSGGKKTGGASEGRFD